MMKEQAKKKNAPGLIDLADAYVAPAFTNLRTDLVGFGEALDAQSILMDMARELDEEGAQDAVSIIDPLEDLPRAKVEESEADLEGVLNALGSKAPKEPGGDDDHSGEDVAAAGAAAAVAAGAVLAAGDAEAAEGQEETQADASAEHASDTAAEAQTDAPVEAQTDDQAADPWSGDADLSAVPEVSVDSDIPEFQRTEEMPELPSQEAGQDNDLAGFDDEEGSEEAGKEAGSATDEWAVEDLGDVDVADKDQDASVDEEAILADDVLKEDEWPEVTELDNDLEEADAAAASNHVVASSEGFLQAAAGGGAKKEGEEEPASVALSEIFASEDDEFSTELGPELQHGAKAWSDPDDEADLNVAQSAEPVSAQAWSDVSDVIDQKEDIPSSAEDAIWSAEAADAPTSEKPGTAAAETKPAWQSMYENPPARPTVAAAATAAPAVTQDEIRLSGNQTADDAAEGAGGKDQVDEDGKASVDTIIAAEQGNGGGNRLAGDAPPGSSGKGKGRSFIIAALTAGLLAGGASYAWVKRDTVKQYVPALAGLLDKIEQAQTAQNGQNGQATQPPASANERKADSEGTGAVKPAGGVDINIDLSDNGQLPSNQPFTKRAVDEEAARAEARNGAGSGNEADSGAAARAEIDRIAGVSDAKDNRAAAAAAEEQAPDQTKALLTVQGDEIRRLKAEIDVLKAEMVKINSIADNANRQANSMASALVDISRLGEESAANNMRLVELTGRVARVELNDPGSVARQSAEKAAGTAVSRIEQRLDDLSADIGIVARMAVKNNANPFGGGDNADLLPLRAAPSADSEPSPERFSRPSHEAPRISDSPNQARAAATPGRRTGRSKYPETISPRKTFTISNNDASRVSRVQRGDFVDGYGYVLEIKPVKGGGRMVIMENGSVYVE